MDEIRDQDGIALVNQESLWIEIDNGAFFDGSVENLQERFLFFTTTNSNRDSITAWAVKHNHSVKFYIEGDLRVWHIINPPAKAFHYPVKDVATGLRVLDTLAQYDLFQGENRVFANAQGLSVLDGGEWIDWESEDGYTCDDLEIAPDGEVLCPTSADYL